MSAVDWDICSKIGVPITLELPKCQAWPNQKPGVDLWRYGRHLLKSIWRHNSIGDHPICIKFGRPVQNRMPMALKISKSKPEVEFQYDGRLSETGTSNISAVIWDISSKFGMPIALDLPKWQTWPNQKSEVDLRRYSRHLVRSIWRHNSVADLLFRTKCRRSVQNHIPMTTKSSSKLGLEFKYGGRLFSAFGSTCSNIFVMDWDIWSKFDTQIVLCLPEGETS